MNVDDIRDVVLAWFARPGGAVLDVGQGQLGYPFDYVRRVTLSRVVADRLVLILDDTIVLTLMAPTEVEIERDKLRITGFRRGVCSWEESGHSPDHFEAIGGDRIEFSRSVAS
jgi:hypothetical protein